MKIFRAKDAKLYIVPTPIGNLDDITERAIETLSKVDIIFCEDTRRTKILLSHIGIKKPLLSLHSYNEKVRTEKVISKLREGNVVAYVTDSGMPGISDPGGYLVRTAQEEGFSVCVLPGPTAFVPALILSGLRTDKFVFLGFPPSKSGGRRKLLKSLVELPYTLIFYESPHRLLKFLTDAKDTLGDRIAAVVREISKIHEETIRGKLSELIKHFSENKPLGEIVVVIEGKIT